MDDLLARLGRHFASRNAAWTEVHEALCQVSAPAFGEGPRAEVLAAQWRTLGLADVAITPVGNVVARYPHGGGAGPRLVVSAHLDTVFESAADLCVRRDGERLWAPGIGDDAAGLAMLPALAEGLLAAEVALAGELWLVATVGEESVGNLRGARELAEHGVAGRPLDGFITLDASVAGQVVRHGTHSRNHELTLRGPGGHAWSDYGVVNPNVILARIVARVSEYATPRHPRTTLNCGLLHGGFAPNVIPDHARGHLNLRSESGEELARLDAWARRVIQEACREANLNRRSGPELAVEDTITERPGGETPADSPLVAAATAACTRQGWTVQHPASSTDANPFMAAGIAALCLYRGDGGGEHTLDEWYDAATRPAALTALAETVSRFCGLAALT